MKKIIFTLLALVGTMSMNAQIIKPGMEIMKNGVVVATYTADQADKVVFKEITIPITGTATRTGGISVNWVQLWEGGPKFAEYNVGAENNKPEDYGGYYAWGGSQDKVDDHIDGTSNLSCTGDNITDTATKLWGSNWRMPTKEEFDNLLAKCTVEWTTVGGVSGRKFTGKGDYASNSVFLPAAGNCHLGRFYVQGTGGFYYSSMANDNGLAYYLDFGSGDQGVHNAGRSEGFSVRAVLNEKK